MRFRNQIAWTMIVQGGGAAAGFVSIALLGIYLGPVAQGVFSFIKIEVAFIGSLAMFGLVQALFYFVQASRMSIGRAKELAVVSALVSGLMALGYGVFVQRWAGLALIAFVFAGGAYAWFNCLRGIMLAATTTRLFNVMTALPQGLLLLYAIIAVAIGRINNSDVALAFTVSFVLASLIGLRWLAIASQSTPRFVVTEERLHRVMRYVFASGVTEIAAAMSLLLAARAVGSRIGSLELGVFTFAIALAQGLLVPVNYTIPLLFKRWMEHPNASEAMRVGIWVVAILGGLALVVRYLLIYIIPGSWLGAYSSMVDVLWIVLFAVAFDSGRGILAVHAKAHGMPWLSATSETLRLIVVAGGLALCSIQQVQDVAWIMCVAAIVSTTMLLTVHCLLKWASGGLIK